jgi:hypothetical protein
MRLIDPETNEPSTETFVDVWRSVPTVNDVALTGPDDVNPWPRGPNESGGYQLDGRLTTLQEQARAALTHHAEVQQEPSPRLLDDLAAFERVLFTNHRVRALAEAIKQGITSQGPRPVDTATPPRTSTTSAPRRRRMSSITTSSSSSACDDGAARRRAAGGDDGRRPFRSTPAARRA